MRGFAFAATMAFLLLQMACNSHTTSPQAVARAEAQAKVDAEFVWPDCEKKPAIGKNCGLVYDEMMSTGYQHDFDVSVCARLKLDDAACGAKFGSTYAARLIELYRMADFRAYELHCNAHPKECADTRYRERYIRDSHNTALKRHYNEAVSRESEAAEAESAEARARVAGALQQFGRDMQCSSDPRCVKVQIQH